MDQVPSRGSDGDFAKQRLLSLDAYRGLIMISLAFAGFGLAKTAGNQLQRTPDSEFWQAVSYQFSHADWVGCSYWDLIQPSFMFMVGVSMAYSYASRQRRGDLYLRMLGHAITRSLALIALSIFLMSMWGGNTAWTFTNVLAQIGLGYAFLFLLWGKPAKVQALSAVLILVVTWGVYEAYPNAGVSLSGGAPTVGVTSEWAHEHLREVRAAWHKNANIGHAIDRWLLNQFPRPEPFVFSQGGYHTINFIPSLATMLFGLMSGELLRSERSAWRKLGLLIAAGVLGLVAGQLLNLSGVCPLVKRIWTPAWTLFSTGWCCLILASLFALVDMFGFRRWTFPLAVVGMNSIAIYCMSMTLKPWTAKQLQTHLGQELFTFYGVVDAAFAPTIQAVLVGLAFWLVCYYLYRNKIFLRI